MLLRTGADMSENSIFARLYEGALYWEKVLVKSAECRLQERV